MNITSREASVNPGAIDSLSEFAGTYTATFKDAEGQAPRPVELAIAASKSGELTGTPSVQHLLCMPVVSTGLAAASRKPPGSSQAEKFVLPRLSSELPEPG